MKAHEMRKSNIARLVSLWALIVALIISIPLARAEASGSKARTNRPAQEPPPPQSGIGRALSVAGEIDGSSNSPAATGNRVQGDSIETNSPGAPPANVVSKKSADAPASGLVINATFDSSITGNPNSAAIQAMINQAIGVYQSLFADNITVSILSGIRLLTPTALLWEGALSREAALSFIASRGTPTLTR